jgi:large subunit ribosomal protein L29
MKASELRELDAEELGGRLKGARRELYELRFKLAVGQQDNHREIRKARKEIARILTIVHQRRLEAVEGGFEPAEVPEAEAAEEVRSEAAEPDVTPAAGGEADTVVEAQEEQAEEGQVEASEPGAEEADAEEAGGGRGRRPASEDEHDGR